MNIWLIDIDSKIPNLALMKISQYHRNKGDTFNKSEDPDKVYISCIFKRNREKAVSSARLIEISYPNAIIDIGGPGYDLKKSLPDEIENQDPDYSIYPDCDYSIGFTTRGCIRACPFCVVPKKEGRFKKVNSIYKIHNPKHKAIKLLDNNILADIDNFKEVAEYCIKNNLKIDISQGLDCRLLTYETAGIIKKLKPMSCFCFAFDSLDYESDVRKAINLLKSHKVDIKNKVMFYVYCNDLEPEYDLDSALYRCNLLKELGSSPYVMLDIDTEPTREMKNLKRWANRKHIFFSCNFEEYNKKGAKNEN